MPKLSAAQFHKQGYDPQGQWCLLHGPEYELKLRVRNGIVERLVSPEDRDYAVETFVVGKGVRAAAISGRAQTAASLSPVRVLVVDGVENMTNAEQRELASNLRAAPGTTVILTEGARGQRSERRRSAGGEAKSRLSAELIKAVAESGSVVECAAMRREEAAAWAADYAQSLGSTMKPAVAALLTERVGTDLGRIAREVEKLVLVASEGSGISKRHVEELTVRAPEDNVFAVGDAIGAGDADQALAVLRDLVQYQGVEPTTALAFIARQFRLIWQTKVLLDTGWRPGKEPSDEAEALLPEDADIRRYLSSRQWLVNRLAGQARRFSWPQLAYALRRVLAAELALKGIGEGVSEPRMALELLVAGLCRRRSGAGAAAADARSTRGTGATPRP
ncbi:MAG: DNA polymerase III subunit delta [Armatimonadota bacterium]|nr:MAG: DNA polymerase III subunit delta [Armatimonadota bacterium]